MMNSFLSPYFSQLNKKFLNAELELRILLKKSLIVKKEIVLSNFNIKDIDLKKFNNYFERRIKNEPISKITNSKSFWKHNFYVTSDVLDPRPETELIIEQILEFFPNKNKKLKILEMCSGSGCIAISIAKEFINSKIYATDISLKALQVGKINAKKHKCSDQINFINCDLYNKINKYDLVICNPPYLSNLEYNNTSREIKNYEPKIALVAKDDGFEYYHRISKVLSKFLGKKSIAFIEIGSKQGEKTKEIFQSCNIQVLCIVKDLQNLDRLLILNKP